MNTQPKPASSEPPALLPNAFRCIDSEQLLQGASTLEIAHAGQRYLLRVTRENKLILTK